MKYRFQLKEHIWPNLIWQPLVAVIFLSIILIFMNHFTQSSILWAVGTGALASSCFIVFGKPSSAHSMPHKIIGGYIIGILSGVIFHLIAVHFQTAGFHLLGNEDFQMLGITAALSAGFCLVLMSVLKLEHPPAAGMALVLTIELQDYSDILIVLIAAIILASIRWFLRRRLVDLS